MFLLSYLLSLKKHFSTQNNDDSGTKFSFMHIISHYWTEEGFLFQAIFYILALLPFIIFLKFKEQTRSKKAEF